jgi:hypothetical protein
VTLSVGSGDLTLSGTAGLAGTGDGTGTLQYQGPLSALIAALEGMTLTLPPAFVGNTTLTVAAQSAGTSPLVGSIEITNGIFLVTNTNDSGPGSLRQAIVDSNQTTGGSNTIEFQIPATGTSVISPLSPLPAIVNPVLIDGFSQPGYTGTPLIDLSGSSSGGSSGLTITGSGVTVRGLDIGGFLSGAGILITGTAATGNVIEANDIGTDPTGTQPSSNAFGVQITDGAGNNLVRGTTAAAGNLIAFNTGPGVDVEGTSSVGDQITSNQIFSNDDNPALQFDGSTYVSLPNDLVDGSAAEQTIEARFQTTSGGVILGYQSTSADSAIGSGFIPSLYVGTDGMLYGTAYGFPQLVSTVSVADGNWHEAALVIDSQSGTASLYLDGQLVATSSGSPGGFAGEFNQIGTGYTGYDYPATNQSWFGFVGQIADVRIWSAALSAQEIDQGISSPPASTAPGLEADYPFDDGQGLTAHDLTSNRNDGTLAGPDGDLPTWVAPIGEAIDLGDDGVTYNASAPRQGPNNLQNFPVVVTASGGQLEGWLGGSLPDTPFLIDFFASATYAPGGEGEAEDFLGSMEVTTNNQGQVAFEVPFTPPAGLPVVTATATDPDGNTSEVSALRQATFQVPANFAHVTLGQPLLFSATAGDTLALEDPDAGPLDPVWDLTLSVPTGTLELSNLSDLAGTGNGSGALSYTGPLSAIDAALETLSFTAPPGFYGVTSLSLSATSEGAAAVQAVAGITNGVFHVTTTADSGPGSLRQAILDADADPAGTNTIDFVIPGQGLQTIAPLSPLPLFTTPTLLDGTTQPGFAGTPLIALSGSAAGSSDGLSVTSSVSARGIAVSGFSFGADNSTDTLTWTSAPKEAVSSGGANSVDTFRIDTTRDGLLLAVVSPNGIAAGLSLLDAQGNVLVQSDAPAPGSQNDMIDEHLVPGTYYLKVTSSGGPGDYILTTSLSPSNEPFQPIPASSSSAIVTGDFTGNGILDLATLNGIYMGLGDGSFQSPTSGLGLPDPSDDFTAIVAGDWSGDGKLDIAVTDATQNTVDVLMGNGNGTFQPALVYAVGGDPTAIVAGDFSGNGRLDLVVNSEQSNELSVLMGNGNGTFQAATEISIGNSLEAYHGVNVVPALLLAGDFSGDGRDDLAVLSSLGYTFGTTPYGSVGPNSPSGLVSVLLGNSDGTFQPEQDYSVGYFPLASFPGYFGNTAISLVAGDFTGNGHLDLAVGTSPIGDYYLDPDDTFGTVLLGNGDGTFNVDQLPAADGTPFAAGDFTGDGRTDLATLNTTSTMSVLRGNEDGVFQIQAQLSVGTLGQGFSGSAVSGDFNGDGRADLALFTSYPASIEILLGNGDGTFQTPNGSVSGSGIEAMVDGDFTNDGRLDVITANYNGTISVELGNGDGTFQPADVIPLGFTPGTMVAGDFNGDGRLDLAIVDGSAIAILLGNGDGTFQPPTEYALPGPAGRPLLAADLAGDGKLDLITDTDDGVEVLMGNGDGTFQPAKTVIEGLFGLFTVGDFNGDGKLDLAAIADFPSGTNVSIAIAVLPGNGDGTFGPPIYSDMGDEELWNQSLPLVAGDFTGDGKLDLATEYGVLLGNGDGTFGPVLPGGGILAGDFTDDGNLDLVSSNYEILLGNGNGTFQPGLPTTAGNPTESNTYLLAGDFTGDGNLDLAYPGDEGYDQVSVLLGNGNGTFSTPSQLPATPPPDPVVADVNGDGTDDLLVVDGGGNILYRQGVPGQPGSFAPPIIVNPGNPSRDIAWVPNTTQGPLLASVDAQDAAVTLYAWRDGGFVTIGSLVTGQLPAQVIAVDFTGDGLDDLIVYSGGDGTLSVYIANQFVRTDLTGPLNPQFVPPIFLQPETFPVGPGVSDVQAVDTTNSGDLDLVITNKLTAQVSVLENLGNGVFAPPVPYRAGTGLSEIDPASTPEVSSLDATAGVAAGPPHAGDPTDLFTINPGSNTLDILAGLGGGRFANPVTIALDPPPEVVRAADFNHDGISDLAVLTANGVSIFLGNASGGFSAPVTYDAGTDPTGLTVADLNHDGNPDLLVSDVYGDVLVLVGQGDGTFEPYRDATQSIELAVTDLTGNGSTDVIYADAGLDRVVVDKGSSQSSILANQSTGLLDPGAVKLADLNDDGIPDLIVANSGSNNVLIYPGLGNGLCGPAVNDGHGYFTGTNPVGITVANLGGNPFPDLVIANKGSNDISILINQGNFNFTQGPRLSSGGLGPVSTVVGNFTGGPNPDILVTNSGSNDVGFLPGVGGVFFNDQNVRTYQVGNDPVTSFVGNYGGSTELLTVNAGSSNLTLISDFNSPNPVTSTIASGGVDPDTAISFSAGDNFDDLVVGNSGDGILALFEGGEEGLEMISTDAQPNLPSPTDLAFASLSGGQVQFYAATAGHEAATLVDLSLGGETLAQIQSDTSVATVNNDAQLVPLSESSLALVASLLTLTVSTSEGELNLESAQAETAVSLASLSGSSASIGQGFSRRSGGDIAGSEDAQNSGESPDPSSPGSPAATPWERFMLGLDQALEQFRREFPSRITGLQQEATELTSRRRSPRPIRRLLERRRASGRPQTQPRTAPKTSRSRARSRPSGATPSTRVSIRSGATWRVCSCRCSLSLKRPSVSSLPARDTRIPTAVHHASLPSNLDSAALSGISRSPDGTSRPTPRSPCSRPHC